MSEIYHDSVAKIDNEELNRINNIQRIGSSEIQSNPQSIWHSEFFNDTLHLIDTAMFVVN